MIEFYTREGATEPIKFILKYRGTDDTLSIYTLANVSSATLYLKDKDGTVTTFTIDDSELEVTDSDAGELSFYPSAGNLLASKSPYKFYLTLTLTSGKVASFPTNVTPKIHVLEDFV